MPSFCFILQAYMKKEFHKSDNKEFTYEDLKQGYFRLLSDKMISEIIPHAIYNPEDDTYDLHLKVKLAPAAFFTAERR